MGLFDFGKKLLDPGGFVFKGDSQKLAEKQYGTEKDIALKNYEEQVRMNNENIRMQQEAYDYQKELNAMQMEREDTAVSRRVQDLKNAGLSPTLAAGSSASATPVHAGTAPQGEAPQMATPSDVKVRQAMFQEGLMKDRMALAMSLMGNIADVSQTKAQTELLKTKYKEQDIINKYLEDYLRGRNLGQNLRNDAQDTANRFAEQLNQSKIDSMKKNLDLMQSEIDKNNAVTDLTKTKRFTEIQEQILNGLRQSKLSAELSDEYLKMMATAYSLQWYQKHDLPYGSASNNSLLLMGLDKALKFAEEGGLSKTYGIERDDASGGLNLKNLRNDDGSLKGIKDSIFGFLFGLNPQSYDSHRDYDKY